MSACRFFCGTSFPDHDVRTVRFMGWTGAENGELLRLMVEHNFDVFVTSDQNLQFQQNVRAAGVAIIELRATSNRIESLLMLVSQARSALSRIRPGELITIAERRDE